MAKWKWIGPEHSYKAPRSNMTRDGVQTSAEEIELALNAGEEAKAEVVRLKAELAKAKDEAERALPVTEEMLPSLGFYLREESLWQFDTSELPQDKWFDIQCWISDVGLEFSLNGQPPLTHIKTRGQVLDLLRALGCEIKEQPK